MKAPVAPKTEFSPGSAASIIILCVMFGANPVSVKISLDGFGPFTNAALRFAIAAVVIFLWAKMTNRPLKVAKNIWGAIITISLILTAQISLFYLGMTRTNGTHASLIANLLPFLVLILSHYLVPGDRITPRKLVGMLLGFSGVVFVLIDKEGIQSGFQIGDSILFVAVFFWACRIIYTKKTLSECEPFHLVLYPFVFATPLFLAGGVLFDSDMITKLDWKILSALAYQSIMIASLGFVIWNTFLKKYGASSLHSFTFIMPVAGVCFSGLLLGEPITPNILTALALVAAGLIIIHVRPSNASPSS
jgi:drug/metabolite transporter (DMT)-like permease